MAEIEIPEPYRGAAATTPDEDVVLAELYGAGLVLADRAELMAIATPGTAAAMLAQARASLGMSGRPNAITRDYASRHGAAFLRAAWCDQAITYWARHSGNAAAVLPAGDRAYTVWHAGDFQKVGRWHAGTAANVDQARPGDIVFFDWGGTDSVGAIDHVGVVEKALGGGRVQTIEGNTSDSCARRVRSYTAVAGYGRPAYSGSPSGGSSATTKEDPLIGLKKGDSGEAVKGLQQLIVYAGQSVGASGVDGSYGDATAKGLLAVRKGMGSAAKPGYGDQVTGIAYAELVAAVARKQD